MLQNWLLTILIFLPTLGALVVLLVRGNRAVRGTALATTLATLGCASGQGYYFAQPLEPEVALDYWKARRKA